MSFQFYLNGETPPKKNSRITLKNGRSIPSKNYQTWHAYAVAALTAQRQILALSAPIAGGCTVTLHFTHGDRRRRDSDNGASSILDALQDAHILADDNWQIVNTLVITNSYSKNNAGCKITIQELENA